MPSVEKKLVCIICLKRFTLKDNYENKPIAKHTKSTSHTDTDPYTKFLQFVSRYLKLKRLTDCFLESAKHAKAKNEDKAILQAFCGNCGELVSSICKLYEELQMIKIFLVWRLSEVGEVMKRSRNSMSNKLTKQVLSCLAKQINAHAASHVNMFRKSLQFKCMNAQRKSIPIIPVHKGLFPGEWKFTYSATKETLIRLIVVFTLGSVNISGPGQSSVSTDMATVKRKNVAKRRSGRPTKIMNPSRIETDQISIEIENEEVNFSGDENEEAPGQDNFENDLDWSSRDPASSMSVHSVSSDNDDTQATGRNHIRKILRTSRGRRHVVVKAEEDVKVDVAKSEIDDGGDANSQNVSRKKEGTSKRKGRPRFSSSALRPRFPMIRIRPRTEIEKTLMGKWSEVQLSCNFTSCRTIYSYPSQLGSHLETVHEVGKPEVEKNIPCHYCSRRYAYQQTHDMHLRTNHKRKLFQGFKCDLESCDEEPFVSMDQLNEHLKSHLGECEKISFCEKCNWGFMRQELRDLHQLDHIKAMEDGTFKCPRCVENFAYWSTLKDHFNKEHGLNLRPFQCDRCDKSFFLRNSLQHHQRYHRKSRHLTCDQCGVTFSERSFLDMHLKSGHLFQCMEPGCEHKFNTNRKLQMHRTRNHVVTREWICEICGHQFLDRDHLRKHKKVHGEKKFSCEFCGAAFAKKTKLKSHLESMHNPNRVKRWICSLCGKSYHTDTGLQYHTDSEHKSESEWNLKCPHCPRRFYRNLYLNKHLKTCAEQKA